MLAHAVERVKMDHVPVEECIFVLMSKAANTTTNKCDYFTLRESALRTVSVEGLYCFQCAPVHDAREHHIRIHCLAVIREIIDSIGGLCDDSVVEAGTLHPPAEFRVQRVRSVEELPAARDHANREQRKGGAQHSNARTSSDSYTSHQPKRVPSSAPALTVNRDKLPC